jgi:hypothetical protein
MKKLFGKVFGFLGKIFTDVEGWVRDHVRPAIEAVNFIKSFIDDKTVDITTALIPGTLDDKAVAWMRKHIPAAIDCLALTAGITAEKDFLKKVKLFIGYMRQRAPEVKNGLYLRLASNIAQSSGKADKVPSGAVDLLTQLQYTKMKEDIADGAADDTAKENKPVYWNALTLKYE